MVELPTAILLKIWDAILSAPSPSWKRDALGLQRDLAFNISFANYSSRILRCFHVKIFQTGQANHLIYKLTETLYSWFLSNTHASTSRVNIQRRKGIHCRRTRRETNKISVFTSRTWRDARFAQNRALLHGCSANDLRSINIGYPVHCWLREP